MQVKVRELYMRDKVVKKLFTSFSGYQYLARINGIANPNLIYVGQKLRVPMLSDYKIHDTSHRLYIVRRGNTLTQIAREYRSNYKKYCRIK